MPLGQGRRRDRDRRRPLRPCPAEDDRPLIPKGLLSAVAGVGKVTTWPAWSRSALLGQVREASSLGRFEPGSRQSYVYAPPMSADSGRAGGAAAAAASGASVVLLTLASAQFLMTLDTSVMNVSIATVAKDVGTTVTGIQTAITMY